MTAQAGRGQEKGLYVKSRRCHGPSGPMQRDINTRKQTNKRTTAHIEFGDFYKERQGRPFSWASASAGRRISNSSDWAAKQPSLPAVAIDGYYYTAELTFSGASRIPCRVRIPQCCISRNGSTPIPEAAVSILPGEHLPFPSSLGAEDCSALAHVDSRTFLNHRRDRQGSYWRWEQLDSEW